MDPEIVEMVQFLDPEIVEKVDKSYISQSEDELSPRFRKQLVRIQKEDDSLSNDKT